LFRRPCHVPPCLINGEGGSMRGVSSHTHPVRLSSSQSCCADTGLSGLVAQERLSVGKS
jgi:hypothetical protein